METLHEMTLNSGHPRALGAGQLLGPAGVGRSIDLRADAGSIVVSAESVIARSGTLHGIGGWFSAALSPSVTLTNAPFAANPIARRGVVFPIRRGMPVTAG